MAMAIRRFLSFLLLFALALPMAWSQEPKTRGAPVFFDVKSGSHPHDVAPTPAADGPVFFTAQRTGKLGILDPRTGKVVEVALGAGSAPHGVIVGPDGAAWITDGGLNAVVRYEPKSGAVHVWPLPTEAANANLNTLT